MLKPTDPKSDLTSASPSTASSPTQDPTVARCLTASAPTQDPTVARVMTASAPTQDPARLMSALLQEGGGCGGCAERGEPGQRPFGLPPLPLTEGAIEARTEERQALLKAAKELIVRLHKAHLAGSITPSDLEMLHALQGWYSLLQAEQDAARQQR